MSDVAILNASPLIHLARGGYLHLLRLLADSIVVPRAVAAEIMARGKADPTARAIRETEWLRVVAARQIPASVREWGLGAGESSVIALALATPKSVAVIDDLAGRRCARALNVAVHGTLGTVLLARKRGAIPKARPVLEDLLLAGMYLSRSVLDEALAEVGE